MSEGNCLSSPNTDTFCGARESPTRSPRLIYIIMSQESTLSGVNRESARLRLVAHNNLVTNEQSSLPYSGTLMLPSIRLPVRESKLVFSRGTALRLNIIVSIDMEISPSVREDPILLVSSSQEEVSAAKANTVAGIANLKQFISLVEKIFIRIR